MARRKTLILAGVMGTAITIITVVAYLGWSSVNHDSVGEGQHGAPTHETPPEHAEVHGSEAGAPPVNSQSHEAIGPRAVAEGVASPAVKSPHHKDIDARSGPAHDVAEAARNNISPEAGLRELEAALALPHSQEQGALLHEARGELFAQLDNPDLAQVQAAFEKALEMTADAALKEEIRYKAVQSLVQAGQDAQALNLATAQLDIRPPASRTGFKLQLLKGQLLERTGQANQAESNYRSVFEAMESAPDYLDDEETLSLARLAALRLTQLYRQNGRTGEVEELATALRKQVGRVHGDSQG